MSKISFSYLSMKDLCKITSLSRSTIERNIADGTFPKPCLISKRAVRWRSDELENYLNRLPRIDDAYSCRAINEHIGDYNE